MAEHLQPREPGVPAKAGAAQKPVLSRYARKAETAAPVASPDHDAERSAPASARQAEPTARESEEATRAEDVVGEGVEISARSPELPVPPDVVEPEPSEATESEQAPSRGADERAVEAAAAAEGASATAEPVRRVEASEVDDAPPGDARWASSVVPVHSDAGADHGGTGKKLPFWKRIALPLVQGSAQAGAGPHADAAPRSASLEPVLARLNALEKQLAANQVATENQLTRFEENITQLWELEEQLTLTEVRERLALLEANQEEIADGLHTVGRNLTLLAVVLSAALAAGLLSLGLLL